MERLPLEGIRVCDFSWVVVGPVVTQMLAVMGAEVIKIESSTHTDINRRNPPYLNGVVDIEKCGNFHRVNLTKKSCTIDLNKPKGSEIARELAKRSDIVVSNFRNGVMERFGVGHDVLRQLKPDLILVSSSGMGNTGPYKDYVCYNEEGYAYGGIGYLTGYEGKGPSLIAGDFGDYVTGTLETVAVLAALHYRSKTGKGQTIEGAMIEAIASQVPEAIMDYSMNGRVRTRVGNRDERASPHNCYPCRGKDKWAVIAVTSEQEWTAFCRAIGRPELAHDERFSDHLRRLKNQDELDKLISKWTRNYTPSEVAEILQKAGVPAGPSLSVEEVVKDPHLNERGFFVAPEHPEVGRRILAGMPWKFSTDRCKFEPAPLLGQDNYYVFHDLLGMPDEEFAQLVGEGIIV